MCEYRQDMPPPGGYAPITFKKMPIKVMKPYKKMGLLLAAMAAGWWGYYEARRREGNYRIQNNCGFIALQPLLEAEADRTFLKTLKKNRDLEEELMKNVPGWEVGKWKGYPVYLTLGPDDYFKPSGGEYFAHAHPDYYKIGVHGLYFH